VGELEQCAIAFIEEVKTKEHIAPLIKTADFSVGIQSEDEFIVLNIVNGNITLFTASFLEEPSIRISGSINNIASILSGKEKLRTAINKREIIIATTFRKLLFLESLFILAKKYNNSTQNSQGL